MGFRMKDWADYQAEKLYELVRNAEDDQKAIDAIAEALRKVARDCEPRHPLDM